jgi:hypothetical protein
MMLRIQGDAAAAEDCEPTGDPGPGCQPAGEELVGRRGLRLYGSQQFNTQMFKLRSALAAWLAPGQPSPLLADAM